MSKAKRIAKIAVLAVLLIGVVGYLSFYIFHESKANPDMRCIGVELVMDGEESSPFVNRKDIDDILSKNHLTPNGSMMREIDTKVIETFVAKNPFVKEVNCFKSSTGKVVIKIIQRTPVIYVLPEDKDGYFLDESGVVIPNSRYVSNIVVATGVINEKYAKNELLPFALFIKENDFWNNQIEQVNVILDKRHHRVVELVPRVGDQIIYLGKMKNFEEKLHRMKVFYDKAAGVVGWGKYSKFNLEYDNQLICTKNKQ